MKNLDAETTAARRAAPGMWCPQCLGCVSCTRPVTITNPEDKEHFCECIPVVDTAADAPDDGTSILQEAQRIVFGARQGVYGHPRDDFQRTADLWESYLAGRGLLNEGAGGVLPQDVAYMMILLKMARLMESPDHRDSIVDIAGYAETAARVVGLDK